MPKKSDAVSIKQLKQMEADFNSKRSNIIASNAAVRNGVVAAATDYREARKYPYTFSIDLKQGDITDQKNSGRCWIFAACNTFRYELIKKYNLKTFELSQNYIFFYDKLEKANYFFLNAIKLKDEDVSGRLYSFLNSDPLCDGGQWDMLANIVKKYGVVPSYAYPDSKNATSSTWLDEFLTSIVRERAIWMKEAAKNGATTQTLNDMRQIALNEVYRVLAITLGQPPKDFDLILRDEDDKVITEEGITPKDFFDKYIGIDLDSRISIINATSEDKPFGKTYSVKYLGNVTEGNAVKYLNLPMDSFKQAVIAQLKDGHPVWFGSDCMKFSLREEGVFDRKACGVESFFNVKYNFTKADRLTYGDSAMNHAMVILGVNLDKDGKPNRWRIENSWGEKAGSKGYYVCSDEWFDEFVYQAVVDKKYLKAKDRKLWSQDAIWLEPWDPMGTLAD
ncbi:MAG: C1 family peptidase [Saccharofermentans sp.]|nr:C1 family peptidase [Saccharofermentans sp.]